MIRQINKPSSQTRQRASAIMLGESLVASWKKNVSSEMIDQTMKTLELFGLSTLYGRDELPLRKPESVLQNNPERLEGKATLL
jgi:hypothetical protein